MVPDATVRFVLDVVVHDITRFRELVASCVAVSNDEPGTLLYNWYLNEAAKTARLVEAYDSVDSVIAHTKGPVFTEFGPDLLTACTITKMDAYGDLGRLADGPEFWPTVQWGAPFAAIDPR